MVQQSSIALKEAAYSACGTVEGGPTKVGRQTLIDAGKQSLGPAPTGTQLAQEADTAAARPRFFGPRSVFLSGWWIRPGADDLAGRQCELLDLRPCTLDEAGSTAAVFFDFIDLSGCVRKRGRGRSVFSYQSFAWIFADLGGGKNGGP